MNLTGKTICLTGALTLPRHVVASRLQALGARISGSVTKNTHILVCGEKPGTKLDLARRYGTEVWDEAQLQRVLEAAGRGENTDDWAASVVATLPVRETPAHYGDF